MERHGELAQVDERLEAARRGHGAPLLTAGPAGIGKTCMLEACAGIARDKGMIVLRAAGDELVQESSFAAVRELLWREVQALGEDAFDGAARLAAPVFRGDASGDTDRDRVGAVLHGLYWLVANLSERAPVAMLIDDAHWLDAASARFLLYLARRVDSLPVLLSVAVRHGEGRGAIELERGLSELATSVLRPAPLSENASGVLVRRALGPRADDELCRSCHEATGGNPFYLRELTSALMAEPGRPTVEVAARVRALGAGTIGRSVLVRLARLGADCERLARSLAVLGPGVPLRHAATLAALDREPAIEAVDRLRAADLIAAGPALSFVHPIVGEAISSELPASRAAALHADAARLLAAEQAPAGRIAAHLLSAEPYGEAWVVEALRAAAREAMAAGAPEAAVSYLRRAVAEPPAPERRLDVLVELGRAEVQLPVAQDFAALRAALGLARDARERAELALELALALFGVVRSRDARAVLEDELERDDLGEELVERLEQTLIGGGVDDLSATRRLLARAERHFARARRGEASDPRMLATLAIIAALAGGPADEGAELARRALRDERLLISWLDDGFVTAAAALCWTDRLEEAAQALDVGIVEAQRRGAAPMLVQLALVRSETALRAGDLDVAEDHAQRGLELGREVGAEHVAVTGLAPVMLERGRSAEAAGLLEPLEIPRSTSVGMLLLAQRGRVRIACGDRKGGLADLLDADRAMTAAGLQQTVQIDWVPAAALALAALGRHDEARRLASRELAQARASGAPRRHGIALSVCGSIEQGDHGLVQLREAVRMLERSPARLEHARALVNLGAGLRVRGQREPARQPLYHALDIAHQLGAAALAEQARSELLACGGRPRRPALTGPSSLTTAELRAARMAADGLSNRDIAQALFVSTKTIESQLSQAYVKLAIRSRSELPAALGPRTPNRGANP